MPERAEFVPTNPTSAGPPAEAAASATGVAWMDLNYPVGLLALRRLGLAYAPGDGGPGEVWIWVDASLATTALEIDVTGLGIGIPLDGKFKWKTVVQGLGVDFSAGPIEIGGGLVFEDNADYDPLVEGGVIVRAPQLSLQAMGAYARAKKEPEFTSFFVFVRASASDGGGEETMPAAGIPLIPGVIALTGFCFGFGFNSQLRVPGPDEVMTFPLLVGLTPQTGGKGATGPLAALDSLTSGPANWVTPQDGAYWGAAGLQAVLCDIISCWALLVLSFKDEVTGALLGLVDMQAEKVARIQADVEAEITGERIAIGASLTDQSYFIIKDANVTGAIDLYVFIGGDHRGEFVLTAGGYQSGFDAPDYWPQVHKRIGLDWSINSWLSASAQYYWMVSSHGMMVGGAMSFDVAKSIPGGSIHGWLSLTFDVTVQWRPFYMHFQGSLTVGLRVTMLLVSASVELGLSLEGWLPPVGGRVEIDLPFGITIGVGFGSQLESGLKQLTWDEFAEQKLPDAAHRIQITAESGLLAVPGTPPDPNGKTPVPWIVSTHGFVFSTRCVVPTTTFHINPPTNYPLPLNDPHHGEAPDPNRKLNVRPMGKPNGADLKSTHTVTIAHGKTGVLVALDDKDWKVNLVTEGLPQALWGTPLDNLDTTPPTSGTGLIDDQYTGIRVSIPDAQLGPSLPTIHATDLQLEDVEPDSDLPLNPTNTTPPNTPPTQNNQAINTITTTITTTQTTTARTNLDTALTNCQIAHTNTTPQTTNDYSPHTNDPLTHYTTRLNNGLYNTNPLLLTT
ncbi:DUF6603 domain-containing protein [Streptomyces sp. BA2]|uniref:DUF6603 domain-containing protein n=1 Tax=Streptomyces sp. BA2 TaxID=436595 RepID=UPI00132343B3|nr:DUF6603 domain-containing protein [Streptomyces sp. BA2]MWA07807.1 hypothetical protein [Streptomyces sp. BA2]